MSAGRLPGPGAAFVMLAMLLPGAGPAAAAPPAAAATPGAVIAGEPRLPEIQAGQRLGATLGAPSTAPVFGRSVVRKAEAGRRLGGTDGPSPEALTIDPRDMFERLTRALSDPRIRPN